MPYCCYQLIWGKKKWQKGDSNNKEDIESNCRWGWQVDELQENTKQQTESMVTASNPKRCYFSPFHKELTSFKVHGLQNTSFAHPSWTFLWKVGTFRAVNSVWFHFAYSVPYQHWCWGLCWPTGDTASWIN